MALIIDSLLIIDEHGDAYDEDGRPVVLPDPYGH